MGANARAIFRRRGARRRAKFASMMLPRELSLLTLSMPGQRIRQKGELRGGV
jgi:hypothetical protein